MSQRIAFPVRSLNDTLQDLHGTTYNETFANLPGIDSAFSNEADTDDVDTPVMEIPDEDNPEDYQATVLDVTTNLPYFVHPTTDFVGRHPVHHPL